MMEVTEGLSENDSDHQNQSNNGKDASKPKTLEEFTAEGFKMLVEATKKSNKLPSGRARDLYESYPSFFNIMKSQSDHVLKLLSMVMKHTNSKGNIHKRDDEDKFEMVVDVNDALLENVGIALDEISGIRRNPEAQFIAKKIHTFNGSWNKSNKINEKAASKVLNMILSKTKNIEKPQLYFEDKINNDSNVAFESRLKYKHNMLKPLSFIEEMSEDGIRHFSHPYEFELLKFKPPKEQLIHQPPKPYKTLEETNFKLITTSEEVAAMIEDLEKYKEIAVDLEHHNYRSFQGFTCLMQISSRDTDYIIDTLSLRSKLQDLNKIFTDPTVVKVFHGADSDILWLQRDLALYVVNMFDTHQAAKVLGFPKLSLAYLLAFYCNVDAQKHFQLADWRIRPLPDELLTYAREDTHYLLYIYDNLRNSLIEKANFQTNLLELVIEESTRICSRRYVKPIYEKDGYLDIYQRSKKLFDNRQKFALQSLFEWRDKVARELDESYAYVLPNHMMLNISEVLPREAQGILACCNPIPAPVRQNLLTLHQIILKAREQPLIKPVLEEQRFYRYTTDVTSLDDPLQCPHDLNHDGEFRDDLPVLFRGNGEPASEGQKDLGTDVLHVGEPKIDVFEKTSESPGKVKKLIETEKSVNLSPYHRYKLAKKFLETVENKNLMKLKKELSEKEKQTAEQSESNTTSSEVDVSMLGINIKKEKEDPTLTHLQNENQNVSEQKRPSNDRKRKLEEENNDAPDVKKIKEEKRNLVKNPFYKSDSKNDEVTLSEMVKGKKTKKKKEKKNSGFVAKKEKEFQPFDYKSVDYEKYRTASMSTSKKPDRKRGKRTKKGGKKNFKISI